MANVRRRQRARQQGAGYIEFLLVAPILLLVAGSTIELARFIKVRQIADVISQEAALEAYRRCDITNVDATTNQGSDPVVNTESSAAETQRCLEDVARKFQATVAATGMANARIILSLYRYDFGFLVPRDAPNCPATPTADAAFTRISTGGGDSAFSLDGNTSIRGRDGREVGSAVTGCQLGRILISELAFFYIPIVDFRVLGIGNSFDVNFRQSSLRNEPGQNFRNAFRETTIL